LTPARASDKVKRKRQAERRAIASRPTNFDGADNNRGSVNRTLLLHDPPLIAVTAAA
jgi:hypothetical protein